MKIKIYTLGCKVNQYESEAMQELLIKNGYEAASDGEYADVTIINSCAVTSSGESKAVRLMHRIRRETPETVIVLTGCMAQTLPEGDKRASEADIILGNKRREDILNVLNDYFENRRRITFIPPYESHDEYEVLTVSSFSDRTRAFLKIEDGCNRFCSYCIIPYARGRVRSTSLDKIKGSIKTFEENGYKEVVVVGINLSCYGQDIGESFRNGIITACEAGNVRIRLGSLEPESMDEETLRAFAGYKNFCPQFHLSLQSGCAETLKRMNRHYSPDEYAEIVRNIRSVFDNAAITTDVMVGFPGETEEEFRSSLEFVRSMGFAKVHVFPYSRRRGTVADRASEQVPENVKKERARLMTAAAEEKRLEFLRSQIGRTEPVLIETRTKEGCLEGYTPNYTPVLVEAADELINEIVNVRISRVEDDGTVFGEIV